MGSTKWLIIVRRGATVQYERLATQFAGDPDVTVRFDRRAGERRKSRQPRADERRQAERRAMENAWLIIDGWFMVEAAPSDAPDLADAEAAR
jgi:hypothetical protein